MIITTRRESETFNTFLSRFQEQCSKTGLMKELKSKTHFEKKSHRKLSKK